MKAITKYFLAYFVEISHSNDGNRDNVHEHTIEIQLVISINGKMATTWIESIDALLKKYFKKYDEGYLNDFPELNGDVTIENLGEVLYADTFKMLESRGITLHKLSVAETPLRTYIITDTV